MVRVTYRLKKGELSGDATADSSLLLVNGSGSSYLTSAQFIDPVHVWSRYEGFQIPYKTNDGWHVCKTIHGLFASTGSVTSIEREQRSYRVIYNTGSSLNYTLLPNDVLSIVGNGPFDSLKLVLDCRSIYDFNSHGRFYSHEQIDDLTIITYEKKLTDDVNSRLENLPDSKIPYRLYVVVKTSGMTKSIKQWFASQATLDAARGSSPTTLYMYHALDIFMSKSHKILIGSGFDRDEVIERVKSSGENHDHIARTLNQYSNALSETELNCVESISGKENGAVSFALAQSQLGLDALYVKPRPTNDEGIYAGLPWFFQFWTRDEAISTGGLISQRRYKDVKQLLFRQLNGMHDDGRLSNRYPFSMLGSADGVGWGAKRWYDFIVVTAKERVLSEYLSDKELMQLRDTFITSYEQQVKLSGKNGLISNTALETWMDTAAAGDVRDGCRIEIQTLLLIQLRLINLLCSLVGNGQSGSYQAKEDELSKLVAAKFFVDGKLIDGVAVDGTLDKTVRPNIFLAHYIYPWLLSNQQWESAFDAALHELWLGWGGIASIPLSHPLFCPNYTGENNLSYHRGDSWYFLNNITGICLRRVNFSKYKFHIDAILASSTYDILWQGSLGFASEVSNARSQSASGCTAQAWSMGTYIELVENISSK